MKKKVAIPEIDPQKLFDEENYKTIVIAKADDDSDAKTSGDKISTLIELISKKETKEFKHDTLKILKEEQGLPLLLKAINKSKNSQVKQALVAACWEANLDCTKHLNYFVDLAINSDFLVTLEATTVIQEMLGPFDADELNQAIAKVEEGIKTFCKEDKGALLEQLLNILQTFAGN
ncbi:MAG: hypothetical protein IPP56_00590 [Bacteroidetes bacterium]|nr:hypothetical protein [Bacteroidota bacterium]MBK9671019.1 hypothetical protein [Bacteroidota bacterium]MBK9798274.1 hypothetical protein [Bacteroidota bacterium]MBP6414294.1 hypothetical protein [Bacteroidia bacterium]